MEKNLYAVVVKTPYPPEAFVFVQNGLDFTVRRVHGEAAAQPVKPAGDTAPSTENPQVKSRHITGRELCFGLRDYAVEQYGLLARPVLARWGIRKSEDFGRIVFALVEAKLMLKTEEDTLADFADVFDFREAFAAQLTLSEKR